MYLGRLAAGGAAVRASTSWRTLADQGGLAAAPADAPPGCPVQFVTKDLALNSDWRAEWMSGLRHEALALGTVAAEQVEDFTAGALDADIYLRETRRRPAEKAHNDGKVALPDVREAERKSRGLSPSCPALPTGRSAQNAASFSARGGDPS